MHIVVSSNLAFEHRQIGLSYKNQCQGQIHIIHSFQASLSEETSEQFGFILIISKLIAKEAQQHKTAFSRKSNPLVLMFQIPPLPWIKIHIFHEIILSHFYKLVFGLGVDFSQTSKDHCSFGFSYGELSFSADIHQYLPKLFRLSLEQVSFVL